MRKKIVAGNWKMNLTLNEAIALAKGVDLLGRSENLEVCVFPTSIFLTSVLDQVSTIAVGGQNAYPKESGAFTGEISMNQLYEIGAKAVLIGHSERREYFNESNDFLKTKVDYALSIGLQPFFCCGEPLAEREGHTYLSYVKKQLEESVFHLTETEFEKIVLAYEPIWAIGTGLTASTDQAEEMHAAIRTWIAERYSKAFSEKISILYGGSCNPSNAKALFACPNVDGGLIGGAALKLADFAVLVAKDTWITSN